MDIDEVWDERLPTYLTTARCRRLPFYRDWRLPFFLGDRRIAALATLFFPPEPLPGALSLESGWADPVSWHVASDPGDLNQIVLTPLYPNYGAASPPKLRFPEPVAFLHGLGYDVQPAPSLKVEGRILFMPDTLDAADGQAEAVRAVVHNEWRRRDGKGHLGAEFLFGLIAPEIALNAAHLTLSTQTEADLAQSSPKQLAATSLQAAGMASHLLKDALGEAAFQAFTDLWVAPEHTIRPAIPESLGPYFIGEPPA